MYHLHKHSHWKVWSFLVICCITFDPHPVLSTNACTTCDEECSKDILESGNCYCVHKTYEEKRYWDYLNHRLKNLSYEFVECFKFYKLDEDFIFNPSCPKDTCKFMKFYQSNILTIPKNFFQNTRHLDAIFLSSSGVQHLQVGSFYGLDRLFTLVLDNNQLTKITNGTLNTLTALRVLDLHSNQISTIEDAAFLGLKSLFSLDLSRNRLSSISFNLLKPLDNLFKLSLAHNLLSTVDFYTGSLKNLNVLYLHDNNIERIDECFEGTVINLLYLQNNVISYINGSCFPNEVSTLNLANNNISFLDSHSLNNLAQLLELDLSKNRITDLPIDIFESSKNLRILDLSQNELDGLKTGIFTMTKNIENLNISSNNMEIINPYVLAPLTKLQFLDISNNNLHSLDSEFFDQLENFKLYMKNISLPCKIVYSIYRQTQRKNITLFHDIDYTEENINGLPCTDSSTGQQNVSEDDTKTKSRETFRNEAQVQKNEHIGQSSQKNFNELMEAQQNLLSNISNEITILKGFLPGKEISRKMNITNELLLKLIKMFESNITSATSKPPTIP